MPRSKGFSIIELMIAITIFAILLSFGLPSYSIYLQNAKIRSTAESIQGGLQQARAEGLKRNAPVAFILTSSEALSTTATFAPSASGPNWVTVATTGTDRYIDGRPAAENNGGVTITGATPTITFNALGANDLLADAQFDIRGRQAADDSNCEPNGNKLRCLRVTVTPGGQVRMCDPAVAAVGDTRRC